MSKKRAKEPTAVGLYGIMRVSAYAGEDKKLVFRQIVKNQITNDGRSAVLDLLGQVPVGGGGTEWQENPTYNMIWSLAVGTGSTPPTLDDKTLGNQVWIGVFDPLTTERERLFEPVWALQVSKTIPAGTLTGSIITEAGIFTRGDNDDPALAEIVPPIGAGYRRLYARQVHDPITKTVEMSLVYDWKLGVTII